MNNIDLMKTALNNAKNAGNDIPVGAVIVCGSEIIAEAHNEKELCNNPILHAEIVAINKACEKLGTKRLDSCSIYVTLEPCPMCAWAILESRLEAVYFGSYDALYGAFGSKMDLSKTMNSKIKIQGGILENECNNLIREYFGRLRSGN